MRGMADLIGWATSPAGVITQAVVALVCQFVGFLIVIMEIVQSRSDFRQLVDRYREIEDEMKGNIKKALDGQTIRQQITDGVNAAEGFWAKMLAIFFALVMLPTNATVEVQAATLHKIHELVKQDSARQHPLRPWVGALFLLVGIVFSFTGQVSGVK